MGGNLCRGPVRDDGDIRGGLLLIRRQARAIGVGQAILSDCDEQIADVHPAADRAGQGQGDHGYLPLFVSRVRHWAFHQFL